MFDWIDDRLLEIIVTVGTGASLGTLWRMVTRPEPVAMTFVLRATVALTVGMVIGGGLVEYLNLAGFVAAGVGSIAAFLSDEVLDFFKARGEKLKRGEIDTSIGGNNNA